MRSIIPLLQVDHRELHLNSIVNLNAYLLKHLHNLLGAFNILQHVNSPTHETGHTLDLVINSDSDNLVSSVVVYPDLISDHHCIVLTLNLLKPSTETSVIAKRNFCNMDAAAFINFFG